MKKLFIQILFILLLANLKTFAIIRYVNVNVVGGTGTGLSWQNAYKNLQDAINASGISNDQIWVAKGTYLPTQDYTGSTSPVDPRDKAFYFEYGAEVYGGFLGNESNIAQRVAGNVTILSGDIGSPNVVTDNSYNVVISHSQFNITKLDGFTISNGYADGSGFTGGKRDNGGGMYCSSSSKTALSNVIFSNNFAPGNGHTGGAMFIDLCSPTLTKVSFINNSATYGGGISNSSATPTLTNVTFSGNSAGVAGGGIYNTGSSPILLNVVFTLNSAVNGGGGIFNFGSSTPSITNVVFSENSSNRGGGIYNDTSSPNLVNVVFSKNTSNSGAAIYNSSSSPNITNATFSANAAAVSGGGIFNAGATVSTPKVKNCIFWGNTRGGILTAVGVDIENVNVVNYGAVISYSSMQLANNATNYPAANFPNIGSSNNIFAQNPLFVNATDPDGANNIFMNADDGLELQNTSPCINKGVVSNFSTKIARINESLISPLATTDITGASIVGLPDMGAYEFQSTALPVSLISFSGKQVENYNLLKWKVANEKAFFGYEIERSSPLSPDGGNLNEKFEKIGQVISSSSENYEFLDSTPPSGAGGLYRLKMIDLDSQFKYSNIIFIENLEKTEQKIYPNPSSDFISITGKNEISGLEITDISGRILKKFDFNINNKYSVNDLPKGVYLLKISNHNQFAISKLMIEN